MDRVEINVGFIIVMMVLNTGVSNSIVEKSLIKNLLRLLELHKMKMVHTYRKANKCIDALTTIACS